MAEIPGQLACLAGHRNLITSFAEGTMTNGPKVEELTQQEMSDISGGAYYFALPVFLAGRLLEWLT